MQDRAPELGDARSPNRQSNDTELHIQDLVTQGCLGAQRLGSQTEISEEISTFVHAKSHATTRERPRKIVRPRSVVMRSRNEKISSEPLRCAALETRCGIFQKDARGGRMD